MSGLHPRRSAWPAGRLALALAVGLALVPAGLLGQAASSGATDPPDAPPKPPAAPPAPPHPDAPDGARADAPPEIPSWYGPGSPEELAAFATSAAERHIAAREAAERLVQDDPESIIGHLVLARAHHFGEANFPRARYHGQLALRYFTDRYGDPSAGASVGPAWFWHANILKQLAETAHDLQDFETHLGLVALYNERYRPRMIAERAWPLLKLRRFAEARLAAREGLAEGSADQTRLALNALCAIEFEAGEDDASYRACNEALAHSRKQGHISVVDLTNAAEAARTVFRFDESETLLLEATRAAPTWYGNPHLELAELYTRAGRFPEALAALRRIPAYRMQRPPHVRDADRNETRRALSAFFLTAGRPADALRITERALVMPDRQTHSSRDPAQDRAIVALLDRRAHLMAAELALEEAAALGVWARLKARVQATQAQLSAFLSGRVASKLLSEGDRLVGMLEVGRAQAAVVPPWLLPELVEVMGAGVVCEAVSRAREGDRRPGVGPYYDAVAAEAAYHAGDEDEAARLGRQAGAGLAGGDQLLAARAMAIEAVAGQAGGVARLEAAMLKDPGVFRRLGVPLPVRVEASGGDVAEAVADGVGRSPRFDDDGQGFTVRVDAGAGGGSACLLGPTGAVLGCGEARPETTDDPDALAQKILDALHAEAFAPRVDLSQADANSLDGTNRVGRDALKTLFD